VKNIGGRRKIIPTHPTEFRCFPMENIPRNFCVQIVWSPQIAATVINVSVLINEEMIYLQNLKN
jgi:hypothetical protein